MNLSPDEQDLYTEWLSKVEVAFSLLNVSVPSFRFKANCLEPCHSLRCHVGKSLLIYINTTSLCSVELSMEIFITSGLGYLCLDHRVKILLMREWSYIKFMKLHFIL